MSYIRKQERKYKKPVMRRKFQRKRNNININNDIFINFCSKKAIKLDNNIKKEIYYQLTNNYIFVFNNYVPYNKINNSNYLLTIYNENKYDFLLLLLRLNNKNYSIFIFNNNDELQFFSVKLSFSEELYKGTLFMGELSKNDQDCWFYHITDILYYNGNYIQQQNLSDKILIISDILRNKYLYDEFLNVCHIKLKSYFLFNHIQFIKKSCRLLFISEYFGENNYYVDINIKEKKEIKIEDKTEKEFIIKKTDNIDVYELYDNDKFDSIACINKLKTSMFLKKEFKNKKSFKIKTLYSSYFKRWIPIC